MEKKKTPLHHAALRSRFELAQVLIENGADPNILDDNGATPLHYAVYHGNMKIASLLCTNQGNKDIKATSSLWKDQLYPFEICKYQSTKSILNPIDHTILSLGLFVPITHSKRIIFMRHAESITNVYSHKKYHAPIRDPAISEIGLDQVNKIKKGLKSLSMGIELFVASPLTRSLQTVLGIFGSYSKKKNIPIIIDPRISEFVVDYTGVGTPKSDLTTLYDNSLLRWDNVTENIWWYNQNGVFAIEQEEHLKQRLQSFFEWIITRKEKIILCVGHGISFRTLLSLDYYLRNCEVSFLEV